MGDSRRENARLSVKWGIFVVKMRGFQVKAGFVKEKMHDFRLNGGLAKRKRVIFA